MAANFVISTRPKFIDQSLVYNFWDLRSGDYGAPPPGPGVAGYEDWRVMQKQSGAAASVDIGRTASGLMTGWVRGSTRGGQGYYEVDNILKTAPTADTYIGQANVDVSANSSGNPRIDQIILEVLDIQHAGGSSLAQIRNVAGAPTAGATLDNRLGAAALPASSILLADLIAANGFAVINTADIRSRRQYPIPGVIPPAVTTLDQIAFTSMSGLLSSTANISSTNDLQQAAALVYLPRRSVGATRLKWFYTQDATTALTGSYVLALYDASGRRIVDTGSVAFQGAISSVQERSEVIAATTFEAGVYYIFMGVDTTNAGFVTMKQGMTLTPGMSVRNMAFRSTTGGLTVPSTILGMTDLVQGASTPPIPLLIVGQ